MVDLVEKSWNRICDELQRWHKELELVQGVSPTPGVCGT